MPFSCCGSLIGPKAFSYLTILSFNAINRRFACSGASTTRDLTMALGTPGSCYDGKVGVFALSHILGQFYLQLSRLVVIVIFHFSLIYI